MLAKDVPLMLKKFKNVGKDDGLTHYEREFKVKKFTYADTLLNWLGGMIFRIAAFALIADQFCCDVKANRYRFIGV